MSSESTSRCAVKLAVFLLDFVTGKAQLNESFSALVLQFVNRFELLSAIVYSINGLLRHIFGKHIVRKSFTECIDKPLVIRTLRRHETSKISVQAVS